MAKKTVWARQVGIFFIFNRHLGIIYQKSLLIHVTMALIYFFAIPIFDLALYS